ncbi:DNA-directed DNA polymerase [Coprinopsis sp. MPI-PUGE-AT-0042]|nr:DNA-directed DNA polymerase [Coprinopsis sp. MPI-PUGE-AT-0042]
MSTTLPLFWNLSSASKKDRLDASVKLIGALEQFQSQFVPKQPAVNGVAKAKGEEEGSEGTDEDEEMEEAEAVKRDQEQLDLLNAQDVSYSIRRLIRGLASPRESSRLGFAVALTELLSRIDTVTCSQVVNLLMSTTKTQGSMSGQEERDMLFARLFGFMSVIRSGLLVREAPLATSPSSNTASSSSEAFEQVIRELLALGDKKSWLREGAWFTVTLAVDALEEANVEWKKHGVEALFKHIVLENPTWSPEKIALVIKLQAFHPEKDWQSLVAPTFKNANLLTSSNLQTVSRILKESGAEDDNLKDATKAQGSAWKPQLHFAWGVILEQLLPGPNEPKGPSKGSLQEFFRVVVDESLFSATSSPQRKYWGFQVFQKALKRVDQDSMPMLFTKNFMRSWINQLSKKDRYLHKIAQQTVGEVQAFVADKPQLGFAVILQLTGANGSQQFDKLTKTKTVESILANMNAEGIQNYVNFLSEQFTKGDEKSSQSDVDSRRSWIIDQLNGLVRNGSVPKSDDWIKAVLNFLVVHGLFQIQKKKSKSSITALRDVPQPPLSPESRKLCRNRLLTCIGELTGQTTVMKSDDKTTKSSASASDGELWLTKVLSTIQDLESDSKHVLLLNEVEEEDVALFSKVNELLAQLRAVTGEHQESAKGAELLILALTVQQYCEEEQDPSSLESKKKKDKKDKKKKNAEEDEKAEDVQDFDPIDELTDVIIGLLEGSTPYMRSIVNQTFGYISGAVNESTIDLLIAQLERRSPAELAKDDDEDDEEMEGDEDDEDTSSSESFGDVDIGDDEEDEEIDLELRNKLEAALKASGIGAIEGESDDDDENDSEDDSEEDEELMDDDQMMAIDEQLAKIFSERAKEKKGKDTNAQREATHFKNRVLDLLDIYMRKHPEHRLVPRLILPLINLIITSGSDETQLKDKAKGILRSRICKAKEFPSIVDADEAAEILSSLHTQARKAHGGDDIELLGLTSIYAVKLLIQADQKEVVATAYQESLQDFLTRKNSSLNSQFFKGFFQRYPSQAWQLRSQLIDLCSKAINGYRQAQTVQLLDILVSQLPNIGEEPSIVKEFMKNLRHLLLDIGAQSCSEKPKLNAAQLKEILKLALAGVRQTKRVVADALQDTWQPDSWASLKTSLQGSPRFGSSAAVHKQCEQIALLSRPAEADSGRNSKKKRKADSEPEVKAKTKTKKVKTKS